MKKKIIAFFIDSLNCGGAEKSLTTLVRLLAGKYDIRIYVVKNNGIFESFIPQEIPVIKINIPKYSFIQRVFKKCRVLADRLLSKGEKIHPVETYWMNYEKYIPPMKDEFDIAVAYQQGFPTYYVQKKVNAKKKICWINADISSQGYSPSFNEKFYTNYDAVVSVSEKLKEILLRTYPKLNNKLYVINDIVPVSLIRAYAKEEAVGFDPSIISVVTVGRLVTVKGYDLALDAAAILKNMSYKFKWYFIGEGPMRMAIESKIHKLELDDYIVLTGALSNPYPFVARTDIYVQPSLSEGFGIALSEAKILKRPIVATNFEVVHNLITNNKNGIICDKNGDAIAQSIQRLISDVSLRNCFSDTLEIELSEKTKDRELSMVIGLFDD